MSEKDMRRKVTKALKPLHAVAVENRVGPGTPDVNHIHGWVELKWVRAWPKRETTVPRFKHFTQDQRAWMMRRWRAAPGSVHLLLQCRQEWFMFTAPAAVELVGAATRQELTEQASLYMPTGLNTEELIKWLCPEPASLLGKSCGCGGDAGT